MKKFIRTTTKMGQMYDYVAFASHLWLENGPYILIEQIGKTGVWKALNAQTSALNYIVPADERIYKRIA